MGEMKVIDGVPTTNATSAATASVVSAPVVYINSANNNSTPNVPRSQPLSSPSSPSSRSPLPSTAGSQPTQATTTAPLQSVRRMGSMDRTAAMSMARKELVMALYELGMSYLKGWGVAKDKPVAFTYFKIAADLVS
jgi:TPR repeat protein